MDPIDREIDIPADWMRSWMTRTHPGLQSYSTVTYNVLSLTALVLGIKAIFRLRQTHRELIADPSSRAAIFSASSARIHSLTRGQFYIATLYFFYALALSFADLAISFTISRHGASGGGDASGNPAASDPAASDPASRLDMAIYTVGMLAIFTAVLMLFPLLQLFLFSKLLDKFHRNRVDASTTLAEYIPEARILTTHIGQLWAMLAFVIIAYWPYNKNGMVRDILLEAVFGSAFMWLYLSYGLNFRVGRLEGIEVPQLLASRRGIAKYGTQIFVRGNDAGGLPQYAPSAQAVQGTNEKAGA